MQLMCVLRISTGVRPRKQCEGRAGAGMPLPIVKAAANSGEGACVVVENIPEISAHDYDLAMLYDALIERYEQVAPHRALPMMAVRLMAERIGLDAILKGLELYGVPWAAERCRYEMTARQEFFARMVAKVSLDDLVESEGVADELAHDLTVFDSLQASTRLLKFFDRLLRRHRARQVEAPPGHH